MANQEDFVEEGAIVRYPGLVAQSCATSKMIPKGNANEGIQREHFIHWRPLRRRSDVFGLGAFFF